MIRFALPVSKILKNFEDLSFYRVEDQKFNYLDIFYDGNDFILVNNHLTDKQTTPRKVYVAKTNVSQWELDDTVGTQDNEGVPEEVRTEANAKASRVSRPK